MSATRQPASARRRRTRDVPVAPQPSREPGTGVIDLHCHLLPDVDDGPRTMDQALALAREQVVAGACTVAATPHVSWDTPTEVGTIDARLDALRTALAGARIPLEVVRGAEIDVVQAAELSDEQLRALALGGGDWLLLEAPLIPQLELEPVAEQLLRRGHKLLLAHPERSPLLHRDPEQLRRLVRAGVVTQVTAGALVGRFGRPVQRFADELLEDGLVHMIASDAHDTLRRPPGVVDELAAADLGDLVGLLAREVPAAVLSGDAIPRVPARRRRKPARRGLRELFAAAF